MKPLLALAALGTLTALPAFAGPYDQPWSIVETYYGRTADSHLRKVIINRIDDTNTEPRNRVVTTPGPHNVVLDVPPRKGFPATQVQMQMDLKPCTRYYMAAELKSPTLQAWQPIVKYEEPIGECAKKFNLAQK
jgi:hypothetical protein